MYIIIGIIFVLIVGHFVQKKFSKLEERIDDLETEIECLKDLPRIKHEIEWQNSPDNPDNGCCL